MQSTSSASTHPESALHPTQMTSSPASSSSSGTTHPSTSHSVFNGVTSLFTKYPLGAASSLLSSARAATSPLAAMTSTAQSFPPLSADSPKASASSPFTGVQSAEVKRQRERERRIMPARLQRVSNLLAGSTIEDELSGANTKQEAHLLPPETRLFLYTTEDSGFATFNTGIKPQEGTLLASPAFASSCRARELIETPDFKTRDDTEMMGKTRTIRSEEDTSDAAYERRHRKPDNVEKKQRRLEKERLVKDRQKLKERIDQLRVADARLLVPILTAREQHQKSATDGELVAVPTAAAAASPVSETEAGGKHNLGVEAAQTMAKLELLRTELLEEANETLKRYDVLLAPTEALPSASISGKRKAGDEDATGSNVSKPIRSISVSGAFATKKGAVQGLNRSASASAGKERKNKKTTKSQSPSTSRKRLSLGSSETRDPKPFKPEDGPVRAENTYANIHARTSGGRFAPKAALSGTTGSTSKINTKGKWKKEGETKVRKSRTSASKSDLPKVHPNSLIENGGKAKPKRVKIILSKRQKANQSAGSTSSSSASVVEAKEEEEEEEEEIIQEPQRAALTLEEAQALLAKAMEDDDEDEEIEMQVKHEDMSLD